jgi:hypothetical protein
MLTVYDDDFGVSRRSSPCCARTRTRPSQTRGLRPSTQLMLKAMGAGPTGRITYAAGGRLDGIGRRAIGDMVSSAVASSFRLRRLPEGQPAQALSPEIEVRANLQRSQIRNHWGAHDAIVGRANACEIIPEQG